MSVTDEQIGKNLTRLRGTLTQTQVAHLMRERGWKWSQATVWAVEKGERPLRLAEAEDLARVLKQATGSVFARGDWDGRFEVAWGIVNETRMLLEETVDQYLDAQVELALAAGDPRVDHDQQQDALEAVAITPELIVQKRRDIHRHETPQDPGPVYEAMHAAYRSTRG